MSPTLEEQIEQLKTTISDMEAQRPALGDEVVDAALAPLQRKLDELGQLLQAQQARPSPEPARQRKLVSLLFMDIAGSTAIAQHMDPEDVREVFDVALKKLAVPVETHGGHVTRFMGDGFLAVFGAPTAREDDPEQAIRAGLEIISTAQELAPGLELEWDIPNFQVRVGVNTGLVALGGLTEAQDTLMGAAVNLAARLESAAPPGGLLISHDTYRHVRGLFDVEPQEPVTAKGFDEPVQVYRALRLKPRAFRTHTRGVEGVETRMVGRHDELKYLQDAFLNAIEEGEGQVVTITGEAGVGKSRLLYEFQNWVELQPQRVLFFEGRGRQEAQGLPYALWRDLFEFRFQTQEDDPPGAARQKLVDGFIDVFRSDKEGEVRTHILGQLLGYDFSPSPHLKGVLSDPEQLRDRGRMYLAEYFKQLSSSAPVVVFLEDIHWADDSSLDALNWLGERIHHQPLLLVYAGRDSLFERRPYWGEGLTYHRRIDLEPLSRRESRQLVSEIFKLADHLPDELRDLVVEGAEGNPFYLEELVKMLVEDGVVVRGEEIWQVHTERLAQVEVPPTLAGVLQARLDSLPVEERVVLQQASVVGRQFWDRVVAYIQATADGSPQLVPEMLSTLRAREMIYRREGSTFSGSHEFIFKHDILREVTYESVLKRLRCIYHGLVADWLISQGAERAGEYSSLIAEHLLRAGRQEQAGEYYLRAGQAALDSYANAEAETHFSKALGLALSDPQRAPCLAGLGEALGRQGQREAAIQRLQEAIELSFAACEHDRVATLYTRLSKVLVYDYRQKAWEACQEGLARLSGVPQGPGMTYLLAEAGRTAFFCAQPKGEVTALLNQAIELAEWLGIVETQAEAGITLAMTKDDPQESINMLQEAATFCELHRLLRTAARAHNNIGYIYNRTLVEAERSFQHYLKAVEIHRRIGDIDGMNMVLWNIVNILPELGQLKSGEGFVTRFLTKSSASEAQGNEILQIAHAYFSLCRGSWSKVLEIGQDQLDGLRKASSFQDIATWNIGLAISILELNCFAAVDDLEKAVTALLENIDLQVEINDAYYLLARISARQGLLQAGREYLAKAAQVSGQNLSKEEESHLLQAEAELAINKGLWDKAVSIYQTLINIYQRGGYRWQLARNLINLGDALVGRGEPGDREGAQEAYRQSLEMFTEMDAPGYVEVLEERLVGI